MDKPSPSHDHQSPARNAQDLTWLAEHARNPGERAWFLQWADAFRRLAAFGDQASKPHDLP